MTLPTLPANPQPIDYEIEKFVEWRFPSRGYSLYFFNTLVAYVSYQIDSEEMRRLSESAIDDLYKEVRESFQAFADALAQQPIEIEPLEWPQPKFGEGYFDVEKELDRYIAYWYPENGDSAWSFECNSELEGILACEAKRCEWLSAQLNRPVIVNQTPNSQQR